MRSRHGHTNRRDAAPEPWYPNRMLILFPSQPFAPSEVDSAFADERRAAATAGFSTALVDAEALDARDFDRAVAHLPLRDVSAETLYRGWMLPIESYLGLYDALVDRGYGLVNNPAAYRHAHHLPESYAVLEDHTPKTVWTEQPSLPTPEALSTLLAPLKHGPVIVKDYVKSEKHHWSEACFIPSASDLEAVRRVATRFMELRGDALTGGLVFREHVPLEPPGSDPQSGMPLSREVRFFFLDGEPFVRAPYWNLSDDREDPTLPTATFTALAARIASRFFTMDVARRTDGTWLVLELGDAQVAGLPPRLPPTDFYRALATQVA